MQLYECCNHHQDIHERFEECPILATRIFEEGRQKLSDAISEVEKYNAVQQLTTMIIPPSIVNMMLNEEDHCF